ncbi:YvrJ family protein [Bacillus paramycoides]|uniref:YvrJ family protein n=1 Tax=Bacillus paramycoides TaxID=2026194 RepID=UPI002E20DBD6|nr:YvrJ family protein [Bacillus paramycoides]
MDPAVQMWASLLGNFGFPVAITIYLLIRFEKKLDRLTDAIDTLKGVIKGK